MFHAGVVVEFDPSSYIVNEDDGFVTFTIVKRNETTPSITVNFSTVSDTAKGNVTLLTSVILISNHLDHDIVCYFSIRYLRLCPKEPG